MGEFLELPEVDAPVLIDDVSHQEAYLAVALINKYMEQTYPTANGTCCLKHVRCRATEKMTTVGDYWNSVQQIILVAAIESIRVASERSKP